MKSDLKKPRIVKFWANLIHFVDKANILVMFVLLSQNKTFFSINNYYTLEYALEYVTSKDVFTVPRCFKYLLRI